MINKKKISKKMFYDMGGFSNPNLYRKGVRGSWTYWECCENTHKKYKISKENPPEE